MLSPNFHRTKFPLALLALLTLTAPSPAYANLFTPGDLIVSTYGSASSGLLQGAPTPITLLEFSTTGGAPIRGETLPTTNAVGSPNNLGVVGQYGSNSEGNIQLSANGQYLTFAGYSATAAAAGIQPSTNTANGSSFPIGTPFRNTTVSLAQSTDTNVPRVAVLVDSSGNVNSSSQLNDLYNTNNPRSVYSANGSTFYISGQGDGNNSNQGVFFAPTGINTVANPLTSPTAIYNSHNSRFVTEFNNNLYMSVDTSSGSFTGIWKFNGTPTSASAPTLITTPNNGLTGNNEVFYSPDGFFFANSTTLYVADTGQPKAGKLSDGGIQKWTFNGSAWILQYTLTTSGGTWVAPGNPTNLTHGQTGFEALTGQIIGSGPDATVQLFAVSATIADLDGDGLYAITDTLNATSGVGESFTELESAPGGANQIFKGVSFAPTPEPTSLSLLSLASGLLLTKRRRRTP